MTQLDDLKSRLSTLENELATLERKKYTQTISLDMYGTGTSQRYTLESQLASTNQTISEITSEIEQLRIKVPELSALENMQKQDETRKEAVNISPNTMNQIGQPKQSLNPLVLIGGLVAALIILK